jgi:hypothetical protein
MHLFVHDEIQFYEEVRKDRTAFNCKQFFSQFLVLMVKEKFKNSINVKITQKAHQSESKWLIPLCGR